MITYLLNRENTNQPFSYLGISKKTCFLCGHVLEKLGMFYTRANHGKMWSLWTLPPVLAIRDAYIQRWERVVNHLLDVLRAKVSRQDLPRMNAVKESTMSTPKSKLLMLTIPSLVQVLIFHGERGNLNGTQGLVSDQGSLSKYICLILCGLWNQTS